MKANPDRPYRFIKKIKFTAILASLLIASLACGTKIPQSVPPDNQVPVQPNDKPARPANQGEAGSIDLVGDWYGPACTEAEGTYAYRWSVNLIKDPGTGQVVGTVKFHDCPGGGRVLYRVTGDPQAGQAIQLTGEKMEGGGTIFSISSGSTTFTFDRSSGTISPHPNSFWGNPDLPMKPVGFFNSGTIAFTVQAQTYIPPGETNPTTPSDASTVAFPGGGNSSSYLSLPLGTYTWCYWWDVGDINNDSYLEYFHAYDTRPFLLDENSSDDPELARVVTLSAPPGSGELPGTCNQP
jgi:predicted small lipoprotein YifL